MIHSIQLTTSSIPLKKPFVISLGPMATAESIIVKVTLKNGLIGWGEANPFMTIHGETPGSAMVIGQMLAQKLSTLESLDPCVLSHYMDSIIYGNHCIKSAFDMAWYDLAAQSAGLPLYEFLGGVKKPIYTDYTVSIGTPKTMAADALWVKNQGFSVIKVKLGGSYEEDLSRVKAIRQAVGMDIPLRLDANQGWNIATTIQLLQAFAKWNIQHCEEPIPRWQFMDLPVIKAESPIPIMSDESCCDHHDAQRLVDIKACDRFNIKLSKSGGIFKALKIIEIAEAHHIPVQVGGFLESRLGFTAAAHFSMVSPNIEFFDFDTPLMFTSDPVIGGIQYSVDGRIDLPKGNGLGARIGV